MLGGSLEENVLTSLVYSDNLAPHIAINILPTDFSVRAYRQIATAALEFYQHHHHPAKIHIADVLEAELKAGSDGLFMGEVLRQMASLAPSLDEAYVRGSLDHFIDRQRMINMVNRASQLLHDDNLEEAREVLRAPSLVLHQDTPGVWLRDSEAWFRFLREDQDIEFSSGIETLDDHYVVPARGELYALCAASGMGKSWFLINVGKHNLLASRHRKHILHITLENSLDTTLQRYTQCFLALARDEERRLDIHIFEDRDDRERARRVRTDDRRPFESIKSLNLAELQRRLRPFQGYGQLLVKHYPTGTLTLGMLNGLLDALQQTDNFKPDLVLLDYLTLMHLDATNNVPLRVAIGQLARNLRGLAVMRDFALVTAFQANRAAAGKQWVHGNNVGEDWSLHGTCDTFLTYNQTSHERSKGIARILVDKARNANDKWSAYIEQQYEIGQFCTDSTYFSKNIAEQIGDAEE